MPRCEARQTKLVVSIAQYMLFTPRDDFKRAVVLSLISSLYCVGNALGRYIARTPVFFAGHRLSWDSDRESLVSHTVARIVV